MTNNEEKSLTNKLLVLTNCDHNTSGAFASAEILATFNFETKPVWTEAPGTIVSPCSVFVDPAREKTNTTQHRIRQI